jgi:hypothetical protein
MLRSKLGNSPSKVISIEYPQEGVRARRVVTRSRARPTGKYPSWKMGRMVQWESHNELNAYRLLDANPAVLAFYEQPLVIRYHLDGEQHIHYPDTLVKLVTGRELWEVKSAAEATRPENASRTRFLTDALPNHGFTYRMVLAEDLGREPRLSNVLTLLKYGRQPVGILEREQVRLILEATGGICWGAATNGELGPRGRFILARLALEGILHLDIEQPLTGRSSFFTPTACAKGA